MNKLFRYFLYSIFLLISYTSSLSQSFEWARSLENQKNVEQYGGITVDAAGNNYTLGSVVGTVDLDPGPGTNIITTGTFLSAGFIVKYDSAGNYVWGKGLLGTSNYNVQLVAIEIDLVGNILIAGSFQGTVDLDPGPDVLNFSTNGTRSFILKLDPDGNMIWVQALGTESRSGSYTTLNIDIDNNLILSGSFRDSVDFDNSSGEFFLYRPTNSGFVQKVDSLGNFLWARTIASNLVNLTPRAGTSAQGNIYFVGDYSQEAYFNTATGIDTLPRRNNLGTFFCKFDSAGQVLWARSLDGGRPISTSLAIDSAENLVAVGYYTEAGTDFDPGLDTFFLPHQTNTLNAHTFVLKLNRDGNFIWAKSLFGGSSGADGLVLDSENNMYLFGGYGDSVDFDPGLNRYYLTQPNVPTRGIFTLKLDPMEIWFG